MSAPTPDTSADRWLKIGLAATVRRDLVAQQAKQHCVGRWQVGVILEAGALKPLGEHGIAAGVGLHRRLSERQTEEREAFAVAGPSSAIEL